MEPYKKRRYELGFPKRDLIENLETSISGLWFISSRGSLLKNSALMYSEEGMMATRRLDITYIDVL